MSSIPLGSTFEGIVIYVEDDELALVVPDPQLLRFSTLHFSILPFPLLAHGNLTPQFLNPLPPSLSTRETKDERVAMAVPDSLCWKNSFGTPLALIGPILHSEVLNILYDPFVDPIHLSLLSHLGLGTPVKCVTIPVTPRYLLPFDIAKEERPLWTSAIMLFPELLCWKKARVVPLPGRSITSALSPPLFLLSISLTQCLTLVPSLRWHFRVHVTLLTFIWDPTLPKPIPQLSTSLDPRRHIEPYTLSFALVPWPSFTTATLGLHAPCVATPRKVLPLP